MEVTAALGMDCLLSILTQIDDFRTFYSFSLTCKQFYDLSQKPRYWHLNIVKRKARFFAAQFVVKELPSAMFGLNPKAALTVREILSWANICSVMKPSLENVLKVWEARGPVAAKLFLCVREFETMKDVFDLRLRKSSFWMQKHVGILFPDKKEVNVACLLYNTDDDILYVRKDFIPDDEGSDDEDSEEEDEDDTPTYVFEFREYLQNWNTRNTPEPLQKMVSYLQKVFGPTSAPITAKFLLKSLFMTEELLEICPDIDLNEEEKLFFQDSSKNEKPTNDESVWNALEYWEESYEEEQLESLMCVVEESANVEKLCNIAKFLPTDEQNDALTWFGNIKTLLRDVDEETLVMLLMRSNFSNVTDSGKKMAISGSFRLFGGEEAKLKLLFIVCELEIITMGVVQIPGREDDIDVLVDNFTSAGPHLANAMSSLKCLQPFTDLVRRSIAGDDSTRDVRLSNCALWRFLCMRGMQVASYSQAELFYQSFPCPCWGSYNRQEQLNMYDMYY